MRRHGTHEEDLMCTPHASGRHPIHCILPPDMLRHISRQTAPELRELAEWAHETMALTERLRGERMVLGRIAPLAATPAGEKRRTIYDAAGAESLPGRRVRGEGEPASRDVEVDEAYDASGLTYDF